jgi:nicotinamidase-related amidase
MTAREDNGLLTPADCMVIFVDQQAGLAFGAESMDRQALVNNSVALARTAVAFSLPIIATTSASKVYSGPMMPPLTAALPGLVPIERTNMNLWEDDACRLAVLATGRRKIILSGFLTEACVSFAALSARRDGFEVFVAGDACGGATLMGHELAIQRMAAAGVTPTSWLQVLLELQRDWTRHQTYDAARAIVESNGGGYGVGLAYARTMIRP